jgi:hypothetical protein
MRQREDRTISATNGTDLGLVVDRDEEVWLSPAGGKIAEASASLKPVNGN